MAKKSIEKKIEKLETKMVSIDSGVISGLLKLSEGTVGDDVETTEWISTGIKALNFQLSGDVSKGIPVVK